MQTVLLIDGENFKGKIREVFSLSKKQFPIWHKYNFKGLLDKVFDNMLIDRKIFYFAKIKEHKGSLEKSKKLILEQRLLKNSLEKQFFEVVLAGRVRGYGGENSKAPIIFKEKGVDVKIAVDMVSMACDNKARKIIIGSSDSDLQPAIFEVKNRGIDCLYLGFELQPNRGIIYTATKNILIRNEDVLKFF